MKQAAAELRGILLIKNRLVQDKLSVPILSQILAEVNIFIRKNISIEFVAPENRIQHQRQPGEGHKRNGPGNCTLGCPGIHYRMDRRKNAEQLHQGDDDR